MGRTIKKLAILFAVFTAFLITITPPFVRAEGKMVYLGGMPAGFVLQLKGVQVVGLSDVITSSGIQSPAKTCGIQAGDKIVEFNNVPIRSAADLDAACHNCEQKAAKISVLRNNELLQFDIVPAKDLSGKTCKLGLLVRDSLSGVGTVTYIEENGAFGALGHPVYENGKELLQISGGNCHNCSVIGITKGQRGSPGELKGAFLSESSMATVLKNTQCGIFGCWNEKLPTKFLIETGDLDIVRMGKASIFSTIEGETPQEYRISIIKVDKDHKDNKNFVIKITDKALLDQTGGIVQGMSGSPIVQNGKLIGAITHVFVNDPTRGYGIAIENMLQAAK